MLARIPGGIDDRVVFGGVQRAEGFVGELAVADGGAALQRHVAEVEDLMIGRHQ